MSAEWIESTDIVVDRSTLERCDNCPLQARLVHEGNGKVASAIAAVGTEVHAALSRALDLYVESGGNISRDDLRDLVFTELMSARGDVQSEAIRAFKSTVFLWARTFAGLPAQAILRYQGGQGDRTGQIARDIEIGKQTYRVTAELDLLLATKSREVLEDHDYKSGWAQWTEQKAADAFQFQLHWWLVSHHYPEVQRMDVRVWDTRRCHVTQRVSFDRFDLDAIGSRVRGAVGRYERMLAGDHPARPFAEKCEICSVASVCPETDKDITEFDPVQLTDWLALVESKSAAVRKRLSAYVDKNGDIVTPSGNAFGTQKPKSSRATPKALYAIGSDKESDVE